MSFLRPRWVQKFYDVFGSKLQGWYDKIDKMEFPPEIKKALQKLAKSLPEDLSKSLLKWIVDYYRTNGPDKAAARVKQILRIVGDFKF